MIVAILWLPLARAQADDPPAPPGDDDAASPAESTDGDADQPASKPFDLLHGDRLLGDWWGPRTTLEEHGIKVDLSLTAAFQVNAKGGVSTRHAHRFPGRYDLEITLDTEALGLWHGGTLYARAEGGWDDGISGRGYTGDLIGTDFNVVGNQEIQLAELWYEQALLDDKLRVRLGRMLPSADFDTNAYANDPTAQFLHTALSNNPQMPGAFTTYPIGIQVVATPCEWFYAAAGVWDVDTNVVETGFRTAFHQEAWTFSTYELGLTPKWETPWGVLPGNYRVGLLYNPQTRPRYFNDLGGRRRTIPMRSDDVGFYSSFDQMLFRENPATDGDEQGLGVFARYGYARADVNEIEHFWSVGGQYRGLIPTRDDDVLAFGVAQESLSKGIRYEGRDPNRETDLELYYNIHVFPWFTVTPDFQWILNPGGENGRDAFVVGVRMHVVF